MTPAPMIAAERRLSIRARLLWLLLAIVSPLCAMVAWSLAERAQHDRELAYAQVKVLADATAASLGTILRDNEAVLARLAARPLVMALDARRCDPLIAEYVGLHPEYTQLGVRDLQGNLVCSYRPMATMPQQATGSPGFEEALRSGRFNAGGALLGESSGRWVAPLTHPIRDAAGKTSGLVVLPLDLLKLNQRVLGSVPSSAIVAVLDQDFRFLARSTEPGKWIGKPLAPALADIYRGRAEGYDRAPDATGTMRVWAFVGVPGAGWRVSAGLPEDEVLAPGQALLTRSIAIGGGVLLLILALAWWLGEAIAQPMRDLAATAAKVARGESAARAHVAGPAEVAEVAREFNRMLDLADESRLALERAAADLRSSEQRYRLLFEANPHPMWVFDSATQAFLAVNDTALRHYGYTREEFLDMTVADIRPAADLPRLRDWLADEHESKARAAGQWRHMKKSGEIIDVEIISDDFEFLGKSARLVLALDITARKQAEEKIQLQLGELQQWYRATLGREERVLELKREVNQLRQRLGESARYAHTEPGVIERDAPEARDKP